MTGTQMKSAVYSYTNNNPTDSEMINVINEALDKISDKGYLDAKTTVQATELVWYDLPDDCTFVNRVEDSDNEIYRGYEILENQIRFNESGTYTIYARRQPVHISTIDEEPGIHPAYHQSIATYARGFFKLKVNDESADGHQKMDSDFPSEALAAYNTLKRKKNPSRIKVVRHA